MNREQMVERVWRSITAHSLDDWAAAEDAVDVIFPQITTLAELEALPKWGHILIDTTGHTYDWLHPGLFSLNRQQYVDPIVALAHHGPLTVIWKPGATA